MAEWTKGEVTYLTKNYGKKTLAEIGEYMERSEAAVGMYLANHRKSFKKLRPTVMGPVASKKAKKVAKKNPKSVKKVVKVPAKKTLITPKTTPVVVA